MNTYQDRVAEWGFKCFGGDLDKMERVYRFVEEALELAQSLGLSKEEGYQLVDYVYDMDHVGEPPQEMGGTMVTLAFLASQFGLSLEQDGERELARINTPEMILKIRQKSATKPKGSALPGVTPQ